jgi:hypothetical protein
LELAAGFGGLVWFLVPAAQQVPALFRCERPEVADDLGFRLL